MRRLLYRELVNMFFLVDGVMNQTHFADTDAVARNHWQSAEIKTYLNLRSEKYVTDNQELYVHLPEHGAADILYHRFHMILDQPNEFNVNTHRALNMFATAVHDGALKSRWLTWFLGKKSAAALLE